MDLLKQVDGAVSNVAKLLMGGKRIDRPGSFMEPTILTDIEPENPAYKEEFFWSGRAVLRVKDEDQAVALDNDSDLPFRRCGSCESDSHRTATLCPQCGSALDTPEQEAYNRAYWAKRRAEEQAAAQPEADAG